MTAEEKRALVRRLTWRRRHENITGKQRREAMDALRAQAEYAQVAQWCFQNYVHLELCGPRSNIQSTLGHSDLFNIVVDRHVARLAEAQ